MKAAITYTFSNLRAVKVSPSNPGKTQFRCCLQFADIERPSAVEFDLSASDLMRVLGLLQQLQAAHNLPIRQRVRRGKPVLRIVTDD